MTTLVHEWQAAMRARLFILVIMAGTAVHKLDFILVQFYVPEL